MANPDCGSEIVTCVPGVAKHAGGLKSKLLLPPVKFLPTVVTLALASFAVANANLVISEIDLVANKVEIVNTGTSSVNMTGYQWCNFWTGSPRYVALATAQIVADQSTSTTLTLPAGGILTFQLSASFITDLTGELGLYINNNFGASASIVDYVAWGAAAAGRDNIAAAKGIWEDNSFVTVTAADITAGRSIQLGAGLAGNTFTDYSVATPTIGVNQVTPAPLATTGSATGITETGATVSGTVNARGASTTVTFEYGETPSYGTSISATPSPVTGSTDTAVSAVLGGLDPGTTYHFRVVGTSANGTATGADQTFTTPGPPSAVTGAASAVTDNSATLAGSVAANGADATVTFEYGETTAYGSSAAGSPSPVSGSTSTAVTAALSGLIPGTTYHYRVVASSTNGTTEGADQTFTTAAPPVPTTGIASGISSSSASVAGTVNAKGASTTVTIEYGETTTYGNSVTATPSPVTGFSPTAISALLSGLDPETTYHFRLVATNAYGTVTGDDDTFTTTALPSGAVLNITAVSRSGNTLTVDFTGPPDTLPATWQVAGSATLASFPDDKTASSTIAETPAGSGNYRALIDVSGEPPSYFVRIVLP
jgi:phosphodiesterase/alkaline phosphatase D-like protein